MHLVSTLTIYRPVAGAPSIEKVSVDIGFKRPIESSVALARAYNVCFWREVKPRAYD